MINVYHIVVIHGKIDPGIKIHTSRISGNKSPVYSKDILDISHIFNRGFIILRNTRIPKIINNCHFTLHSIIKLFKLRYHSRDRVACVLGRFSSHRAGQGRLDWRAQDECFLREGRVRRCSQIIHREMMKRWPS